MKNLLKIKRLYFIGLFMVVVVATFWACKDSNMLSSSPLDESKLNRLAKTYVSEVTDAEYQMFNKEYELLNEDELRKFNEIVIESKDASKEEKELFININNKAMLESKRLFNKPVNQLNNEQTYELFNEIERKENASAKKSGLCQSVTYGNQRASIVNGYNTNCSSVYYVSPQGQNDVLCDIECQFSGLNKTYSNLPIDGSTTQMRNALKYFPTGTIMARQSGKNGYVLLGIRVFRYVTMKDILNELKMKK